jgi:hypothetical protein
MFISFNPVLREHFETDAAHTEAKEFAKAAVMDAVRIGRDKLLASSDWTQFNDSPLSAEVKAAWAVYRQALRDITQTSFNWESEFTIDEAFFPAKPESV